MRLTIVICYDCECWIWPWQPSVETIRYPYTQSSFGHRVRVCESCHMMSLL